MISLPFYKRVILGVPLSILNICNIYSLDTLFMTASHDSTLKFWSVDRAGVTRKYIPKFDRAEKPLTKVFPDDEFALAAGYHVR